MADPPAAPPARPAAGAYFIDSGRVCILWLGSALSPSFYQQAFAVGGPPADGSALSVEPVRQGSELSARLNSVLRQLRNSGRREVWQECYVVQQGTPMEAHVVPFFVEDRMSTSGSLGYLDFMLQLQKGVMAK